MTIANIINRLTAIFSLLLIPATGMAEMQLCPCDKDIHYGFSYMLIGTETITYQEKASILSVKTKTTVTNPAISTGGLIHFNDRWDFSIDASSTLMPKSAEEKWNVSGGSLNGLTADSNPIQTNRLTFANSGTRVMTHYKMTPEIRLLGGGDYSFSTFKRYRFHTDYPSKITVENSVVEETTTMLNIALGAQYHSATSLIFDFRYFGGVLFMLPLYRQAINTSTPDLTFTTTNGYGVDLMGGFGTRVAKGVHVGVSMQYGRRWINGESKQSGTSTVELPENTTDRLAWGVVIAYDL